MYVRGRHSEAIETDVDRRTSQSPIYSAMVMKLDGVLVSRPFIMRRIYNDQIAVLWVFISLFTAIALVNPFDIAS